MALVDLYKAYCARKDREKELLEENEFKKKFFMVHNKTVTNTISNVGDGKTTGSVTTNFYLFENGFRERRTEITVDWGSTDPKSIRGGYDPKSQEYYRTVIYPWENGVDHVDIKSYQQLQHQNMGVALSRPAV